MKTTRIIEMTVAKSETLTVFRTRKSILAWCALCGREVKMLTPEEAGKAVMSSPRKIYSEIEAGNLHVVELPDESLLVCLNSLRFSGRRDEQI